MVAQQVVISPLFSHRENCPIFTQLIQVFEISIPEFFLCCDISLELSMGEGIGERGSIWSSGHWRASWGRFLIPNGWNDTRPALSQDKLEIRL